MLPPAAIKNDVFYVQPLPEVMLNPAAPWFKATLLGKNTLGTMMKRMCEKAGISGGFTNHSLCAYGTTTLFRGQIPEKLIQQRTGHRSLEALRQYEHTLSSQLRDVSNVMSHGGKVYGGDCVSATKQQISSKSQPMPSTQHENVTFILNNCSFSHCSVSLSGQAINPFSEQQAIEQKRICEETLKGIQLDDIFED